MGGIGAGGLCGGARRCVGGLFCDSHSRRCRPFAQTGQSCLKTPCAAGLQCAGGVCRHPGAPQRTIIVGQGAACGGMYQCSGGLRCDPRIRRCVRVGAHPAPGGGGGSGGHSGYVQPGNQPVAWIYEHGDYKGRSKALLPGRHGIGVLRTSIGNDQLSSIRLAPGWEAVLYEHNFAGRSRLVRRSETFVGPAMNDKTSSLVIRRRH